MVVQGDGPKAALWEDGDAVRVRPVLPKNSLLFFRQTAITSTEKEKEKKNKSRISGSEKEECTDTSKFYPFVGSLTTYTAEMAANSIGAVANHVWLFGSSHLDAIISNCHLLHHPTPDIVDDHHLSSLP